jgi:hypothetical protein
VAVEEMDKPERFVRAQRFVAGSCLAGREVAFQLWIGARKAPPQHGCQFARTHLLAA